MTTVSDCWDRYVTDRLSQTVDPAANTRLWRRLNWFAAKDAEALTPMEVDGYVSHRGVQPATINRELALLRAALRHAAHHGLIQHAPYIKTIPGATPRLRACSAEEVTRLIGAADAKGNWREMVFVRLALATGARPGAILDLTWDRVLDGVMDFRKNGGHSRMKRRTIVPINDMARLALQIARRHKDGPYVLHWNGGRLSSPRKLFKRVANRAGVVNVSPHVMRHTVASFLLEQGEDLLKVSRLLGHASTKITEETYFQHAPRWLTETTERLTYSTTTARGTSPNTARRMRSGRSSGARSRSKGSPSRTRITT